MRYQGLKAITTTDNLIDMIRFEILNNHNFYGAFINAEGVDFAEKYGAVWKFLWKQVWLLT